MEQELILYNSADGKSSVSLLARDGSVWLNQMQLAELFATSVPNISQHINNILKDKELTADSVIKNYLTTATDGKPYQVKFYSLEMILAVGFRVRSIRGVQFRQWANKVLKEYLLKGHAINYRLEQMDTRLQKHERQIEYLTDKVDFFVRTSLPPVEGIFYDGQLFDAYKFATDLIRSARVSLLLIDNYVDESVLLMLSKRNAGVKADIYTQAVSHQLQLDVQKHNSQYPPTGIHTYKKCHDRFLIIDGTDVYHIGASLKDLGKKMFAFSKLEIPATAITALLQGI